MPHENEQLDPWTWYALEEEFPTSTMFLLIFFGVQPFCWGGSNFKLQLGGGFKYFVFLPLLVEMIQSD